MTVTKTYSATEYKSLAPDVQKTAIVRKDFASTVVSTDEDRSLLFVISTNAVDRSLDTIDQSGWELTDYLLNPVVLWVHNLESVPVGRVTKIGIEDKKLKAVVQFAPSDNPAVGSLAEGLYQHYKTGFLSATSVGFNIIESSVSDRWNGAEPGLNITKQTLVELSLVTVPANPQALIERTSNEIPESTMTPDDATKSLKNNNNAMLRARRSRRSASLCLSNRH